MKTAQLQHRTPVLHSIFRVQPSLRHCWLRPAPARGLSINVSAQPCKSTDDDSGTVPDKPQVTSCRKAALRPACMVNVAAVFCHHACLVTHATCFVACKASQAYLDTTLARCCHSCHSPYIPHPCSAQLLKPKCQQTRRRDPATSQAGEGQQAPQAIGQEQPNSSGDGNREDPSHQQVGYIVNAPRSAAA
jgi:hypothetical protein